MTEEQKKRYRQLLADQKLGKKVDFHKFHKDVEREKQEAKEQHKANMDWMNTYTGTFGLLRVDNFDAEAYRKGCEEIEFVLSDRVKKISDMMDKSKLHNYQNTITPLSWINDPTGAVTLAPPLNEE